MRRCGAPASGTGSSGRATARCWQLAAAGGEADCVICELPEDAEALQAWMERFGLKYRGQRLAGATNEVFLHLLRTQREVPQQREQILASQGAS